MQCDYYDAGRCRSCTLITQPYAVQLDGKQRHARAALGERSGLEWLPPAPSAEERFRNKAKMVVAGTAANPVVGILGPDGRGVDLRWCGLHERPVTDALTPLAEFVTRAGLTPYDVAARRGELKYLLVTASPDGELMVRFVVRSTEALGRIRKHLPALRDGLPRLAVASVNLQPEPKAIIEGPREIPLTDEPAHALRMTVNHLDLYLRPQSFFQTNTAVAAALYREAVAWLDPLGPETIWDLYCGVGGFALHLAAPGRTVTGIETSAEAIASARHGATLAGLENVRFVVGDATNAPSDAASGDVPDVAVVNPPRRGLGRGLAERLERSGVRHVLYSSCSSASLARDLAAMPSLRPVRARVLDMFPQTAHYEVLTLLERRARGGQASGRSVGAR